MAAPLKTRGYAHRVDVRARAATVWEALTVEPYLRRWMNPDARIKARVGGSFYGMPAPGLVRDALIDVFDAPRRLRLIYLPPADLEAFDGAVVDDYLLEESGAETIVRLLGSGIPDLREWDDYYRQVRNAQERSLARLTVLAAQLQGSRAGLAPGKSS
ncbi:MAG: SRPBCC domain-containing protein [Steroidobacteraceae bacterium]